MSHHVVSQVYKRQIGKLNRKAVLALMADKASDDGRGIWASKQTMADELGCTKQTILEIVGSLVDDGLLIVVGEQECANGYTVEYRIDVEVLEALPLVRCHERREVRKQTGQNSRPVKTSAPTGQNSRPHRSKILTQTTLEPSLNLSPPTPRDAGRRVRAPISNDWQVPGVETLPAPIRALAACWPDGAYAAEAAAFHQRWLGSGRPQADWAARWASRVQDRHAAVMAQAGRGVPFAVAPPGADRGAAEREARQLAAKRHEDERSAALHVAIGDTAGREAWERWWKGCALVFADDTLTVVAPGQFTLDGLRGQQGDVIGAALGALGWHVEAVRYEIAAQGRPKSGRGGGTRRA